MLQHSHTQLFSCLLPMTACTLHFRVEWLQQRQHVLQSWKCLLSGHFQEKFVYTCFKACSKIINYYFNFPNCLKNTVFERQKPLSSLVPAGWAIAASSYAAGANIAKSSWDPSTRVEWNSTSSPSFRPEENDLMAI